MPYAQSKLAAQVVDRYEHALAAEARRLGLDGVICGHIHRPHIRTINGVTYINDGDWVRTAQQHSVKGPQNCN